MVLQSCLPVTDFTVPAPGEQVSWDAKTQEAPGNIPLIMKCSIPFAKLISNKLIDKRKDILTLEASLSLHYMTLELIRIFMMVRWWRLAVSESSTPLALLSVLPWRRLGLHGLWSL
jgi:hypothetical protein